jgi:hypothetical protein
MPASQVGSGEQGLYGDRLELLGGGQHLGIEPALEEQRNGEWRYLKFLQVTSLITADIFMREIPGGTRARHRSRPVDLPEHRY